MYRRFRAGGSRRCRGVPVEPIYGPDDDEFPGVQPTLIEAPGIRHPGQTMNTMANVLGEHTEVPFI